MSDPVAQIGKVLFDLRDTAIMVPVESLDTTEWKAKQNHCHHNTTEWVAKNPDWRAVGGWLFFDFHYVLGFVRFVAHSVVADPRGRLVDLTPRDVSELYPFIEHPAGALHFEILVEKHNLTGLDYKFTT